MSHKNETKYEFSTRAKNFEIEVNIPTFFVCLSSAAYLDRLVFCCVFVLVCLSRLRRRVEFEVKASGKKEPFAAF